MKNLYPQIILYLVFSWLILSCQQKPAPVSNTTVTTDTKKTSATTAIMTYENATVYAAATDYYFKDKDEVSVKFRVSNMEENPQIIMPTYLLESDVEEGPPGANPKYVGKKMQVTYGADNQIKHVKLIASSSTIAIKTGSTIQEIQALNGKPFFLAGFEIDAYLAGKVIDWQNGALTDRGVQFEITKELPIEEYQQIMGDEPISSEHPLLKKAALKVIFAD